MKSTIEIPEDYHELIAESCADVVCIEQLSSDAIGGANKSPYWLNYVDTQIGDNIYTVAIWRIRKTSVPLIERVLTRFYGASWDKMQKYFYE